MTRVPCYCPQCRAEDWFILRSDLLSISFCQIQCISCKLKFRVHTIFCTSCEQRIECLGYPTAIYDKPSVELNDLEKVK